MSFYKNPQGRSTLVVLILGLALLVACGQSQKVGSENLLDFEEQEGAKRLGEREKASPEPPPEQEKVTLGGGPSPSPEAPKSEEVKYFDVALVPDSPYYEPGNELTMTVNLTLRVTNRDATAERPKRSFTARDGSFSSGPLVPGQVWTFKFPTTGAWELQDDFAPFIFGTIQVIPPRE
ncbi:MAG: hypothetical protein KY429_02035 [Actinobacteria bacterium]|nr:hypothetical protein [Actinomycetota bacterium]